MPQSTSMVSWREVGCCFDRSNIRKLADKESFRLSLLIKGKPPKVDLSQINTYQTPPFPLKKASLSAQ